MDACNLDQFEKEAETRLSSMARDYYAGGAGDEFTLRENREAWGRFRLRYRVLADVGARDLSTTVLGHRVDFPVLVAPTGFQRFAHDDGEVEMVRGSSAAGTILTLSTMSTMAVEEVVAASSKPVWFQLYVLRDREVTAAIVRRAEAAGCTALMLTVDVPVVGWRERDERNRFEVPPDFVLRNLEGHGLDRLIPGQARSNLAAFIVSQFDPSLSWKDLDWLRSITRLPLIIKGIVRSDDARRAVDHGVAAVVVSNHGGRQLDGAVATADALVEVVDAVDGGCEVLVDGGIRRGTDVLRAVALGARAVMIGRPALWGLTVDGAAGTARVLGLLREQLDNAMALCGCRTVDEITRDLIA